MGVEISLNKYCTAPLPIDNDDIEPSESNELMNECAKKELKHDISSSKINTSFLRRKSKSTSISKKKYSYHDIPLQPSSSDDDHHVQIPMTPKHSNRFRKRRNTDPVQIRHISPYKSSINGQNRRKTIGKSPSKQYKAKRNKKRRDSRMSIKEELEECEIKIKQEQHEKDVLKSEIIKLRMVLAKYAENGSNGSSHSIHSNHSNGSNFKFPTSTNTDYGGLSHSHSMTIDADIGFPKTPKTPNNTAKSNKSALYSRRSFTAGTGLSLDVNNNGILSPLSPLSESQQNIILTFPSFPDSLPHH